MNLPSEVIFSPHPVCGQSKTRSTASLIVRLGWCNLKKAKASDDLAVEDLSKFTLEFTVDHYPPHEAKGLTTSGEER
jgi:hypothetical protein